MLWFIRRLFMLWLILVAICAVVIVIARREPVPDTLQAFGFDWCAGEPCLRGVTVGMSRDEALSRLPDASSRSDGILYVPFDKARFGVGSDEEPPGYFLYVSSTQTITSILVYPTEALKVPIGKLVAQYGSPCRMGRSMGWARTALMLHYTEFGAGLTLPNSDPFPPTTLINVFVVEGGSCYCDEHSYYPTSTLPGFRFLGKFCVTRELFMPRTDPQ